MQMIVQFCTQTRIFGLSNKLGLELEMCSKWLVDDKLSLHMGKTECIIFGSNFYVEVMVIQLRHSVQ